LDAANILFNVLKVLASNGVTIGPILLGAAAPVHILEPSATVRRLVNMTALAVADAAALREAAGLNAATGGVTPAATRPVSAVTAL
jgi:malate dehydrogenase (oxaloacetate-decarboxylating)(NADP+)